MNQYVVKLFFGRGSSVGYIVEAEDEDSALSLVCEHRKDYYYEHSSVRELGKGLDKVYEF